MPDETGNDLVNKSPGTLVQQTGISAIISTENKLITLDQAQSIAQRKELKVRQGIYVCKSKDTIEVGDIRKVDGIWPGVDFPSYVGSLDGNDAWGTTRQEALDRYALMPKLRPRGGNPSSLVDHFGAEEIARAECPVTMDDAACKRYAAHLAEALAYMACVAPQNVRFDSLVSRERIVPEILFRVFGKELTALFGQIQTLAATIPLLLQTVGGDQTVLQGAISPIIQAVGTLTLAFVRENAEKLAMIHAMAMSNGNIEFTDKVSQILTPPKR